MAYHRYFISLALLSLSPQAMAATQDSWSGAVSETWSVPGNWSAGVPANGDDLVFPTTATHFTVNYSTLQDTANTFPSFIFDGDYIFSVPGVTSTIPQIIISGSPGFLSNATLTSSNALFKSLLFIPTDVMVNLQMGSNITITGLLLPDDMGTFTISGGTGSSFTLANPNNTSTNYVINTDVTLQFTNGPALGQGFGSITLTDGTVFQWINPTSATTTSNTPMTLNAGGQEFLISNDLASDVVFTISVAISGTNSNLTLNTNATMGNGATYVFSGTNTYSGNTIVGDDLTTLQINGDSSIGGTGTTGTLQLNGGSTVVAGNPTTTVTTHPLTLVGSIQFINAQANVFTISSAIGGSTTELRLEGTGTINLEGANTYTDFTQVNVPTVGVSGTSPFGTGSVTFNTGTVLQAVGDSSFSNTPIDIAGGVTFNSQTFDLTIGGIVTDAGALTIDGSSPGVVTLGGMNTYMGGTIINSGATLSISSDANLGMASTGISLAGTLVTTGSFADTRTITLTGSGTISPAVSTTLTWNGVITQTGTQSLTMDGAGTLVLGNNTNDYSGGTFIDAGALSVAVDADLGDLSGGISLGTATLATTTTFSSARAITLTGAGTINPAPSTALTLSTGIVGGTNSLTMGGLGQLILTGNSTYTGGTTINFGELSLSGTGSLAPTGAVTLNGSGMFDISFLTPSPASTTIGDLSSSSTMSIVTLGGNNLTFGTSTPTTTFAGEILGSGGSLTKQGSGTFILTGTNSYSGGTTINAGTFSLSGAGSISTTGFVAVNGASTFDISGITASGITIGDFSGIGGLATLGLKSLTFGTSNSTSFTNTISGTGGGSLIKQGTGTFTASGANTYTAGTTINAGTFSLSGSGSLASTGAVTIAASSTFDISGLTSGGTTIGDLSSPSTTSAVTLGANALTEGTANSTTFAGVISSGPNGSFIKQGTGTLTLTNTNTYTGGTTISAGKLSISTSTGALAPTGSVTINGSGIFDISGVTTGTFTIGDLISGSSSSTVTLGANTLTTGTADSTTFAGSISGTGGVTKVGSGTLTLSGNNTFIGDMTINQGQLTVNGVIDAPTIVSVGTTLSGTGTIDNSITISGTLRPGNSVGTLNAAGPVTFNTSSTFVVELNPTTADLLNVSPGVVDILGGSVFVIPDPGSYPTEKIYPIIKARGVTGKFNSVTLDPLPLITPTLIYEPTAVLLVLEHGAFFPMVSGNASGVAHCLDTVAPASGSDLSSVVDVLFFVTSTKKLKQALLQLQPALFKGFSIAQENMTIRMRSTLTRHADYYHQNKYLRDAMWNGQESEREWTIWADAIGDIMHQRGFSGAPGLTTRGGGGIIGADRQMFDDFYLGFSGAYTYDGIQWHQRAGYGDVQSAYGTAYMTYSLPNFYVNASLTGAYNRYFSNRHINFSTFETIDRHARSMHEGGEGAAYLGFGGLFQISDYSINPYISGDYIYLHENAFTEHGAQSLDLHVHQNNSSYLRGEAGLAANIYLNHNEKIQWLPSVKMGVVREWRFLSPHYLANLKGLPCTFMVTGLRPDRTIYTPGASLTAILLDEHLGLTFGYNGEFGRDYIDNNLDFQIDYSF